MRHRHLDVEEGSRPVAAITSILERGGASDVIELLAELRRDPKGPTARAVRVAIRHADVYGYPELIRECLDRWEGQ